MKFSARAYTINLTAAAFIFLFTYTALSKFMTFPTFRASLQQSPLIKNFASQLAWLLPVTELFVSVLLFIPATRTAGLYGSLVLMILFTGYIGYMLAFTPDLPCSCGGVLQAMGWKQHLWFNISFTALAATAIRLQVKAKQAKPKTCNRVGDFF